MDVEVVLKCIYFLLLLCVCVLQYTFGDQKTVVE